MKVGIMSDSHDHLHAVRAAVEQLRSERVEHVIHAGDICAPFVLPYFEELGVPITAVFGNNDGERLGLTKLFASLGGIHKAPHAFELGGLRILVTHHPDFVEEHASSGRYDVVIYGHTHRPEIRKIGGCLAVNPGETCGWLYGRSSIAILDTEMRKCDILDWPQK